MFDCEKAHYFVKRRAQIQMPTFILKAKCPTYWTAEKVIFSAWCVTLHKDEGKYIKTKSFIFNGIIQ